MGIRPWSAHGGLVVSGFLCEACPVIRGALLRPELCCGRVDTARATLMN